MSIRSNLLLVLVAAAACSDPPSAGVRGTSTPAQRQNAAPALAALTSGKFDEAGRAAADVLARDPKSSTAAVVRALSRYEAAVDALVASTESVVEGMEHDRALDDARLRSALVAAEEALAAVDADLAIAAADPDFALELCLACWERDWNRSGEVDDRDRLLFQVEVDQSGAELPEGDPRRSPTFRFDVGDVLWARAMIAFQRAALDVVASYSWSDIAKIDIFGAPAVIRFPLVDRARVGRARDLVLAGLDFADGCRAAYLAETDDDREWVPNPRQKSYAAPLPVDQALYDTWAGVVGDLRRIVHGEEGLDVAELARLANPEWSHVPHGFIDVGRMFSEPRDLVIDVPALERLGGDEADKLEGGLRSFFGVYYRDQMKPSPLVGRLARMRAELERGDDQLEHKLRYLFWLN